jgi:hypothetical protein
MVRAARRIPGKQGGAQRDAELGPQSAAGDEGEGVRAFGELVGERHCHSAAEGMTHQAGLLVAEAAEQVAQPRGVRTDRVVGVVRGVRLAVAEQVGGKDVGVPSQAGDDIAPVGGVPSQAVDQNQDRPAVVLTGFEVAHRSAVQRDVTPYYLHCAELTMARGAGDTHGRHPGGHIHVIRRSLLRTLSRWRPAR